MGSSAGAGAGGTTPTDHGTGGAAVQKSLASWLVLRGDVSQLHSDAAARAALESFWLDAAPLDGRRSASSSSSPSSSSTQPAALHADGETGGACADGCPLIASYDNAQLGGHEKMAALLTNSQCVVRPLDSMLEKAQRMFDAGAYVHQYEAHGVERSTFEDAFTCLEQVVQNYRSL